MAAAPVLDLVSGGTACTDIATIVAQNPVVVLTNEKQRTDLYAHIRKEIAAFVPDLTTDKGRKAIAALAFKVTRTKTAIDDAGKQLNEDARAKINVVDAARRDARDTLTAMAAEARKALTDWEDAEEKRVDQCRETIAGFKRDAVVTMDDTADTVRRRGTEIWAIELDPDQFGDMLPEAQAAKDAAVVTLRAALARLVKEEADRAELEKLRAEKEARDAEEARIAAAQEEARREAEELRLYEERRAAAEKAEADRIAAAQVEAAERARKEAQDAADAESDRISREHEAELNAERNRAIEAERQVQAERDRQIEAAAVAKKLADEQAELEQNKAHRTRVKTAAKQAIMTCGADEETAQKIVLAMIAGEIPNVTLRFS